MINNQGPDLNSLLKNVLEKYPNESILENFESNFYQKTDYFFKAMFTEILEVRFKRKSKSSDLDESLFFYHMLSLLFPYNTIIDIQDNEDLSLKRLAHKSKKLIEFAMPKQPFSAESILTSTEIDDFIKAFVLAEESLKNSITLETSGV